MTHFSASLGYLWKDLYLPDAIRAAKAAGFQAVECHWPYAVPVDEVKAALNETGLDMLGINTNRGDVDAGENGLAAVPGREVEAKASIDQAVTYAAAINAKAIHVMAGNTADEAAPETFISNLKYACDQAARHGINILIEPLNRHDAPAYFLRTTDQAVEVINAVAKDNLRLMFDCYHVGRTEGDVCTRLRDLQSIIGHIQFASVPDRGRPDGGRPDGGELNYTAVFATIEAMGWNRPLGAEYRPDGGDTDGSLGWMRAYVSL